MSQAIKLEIFTVFWNIVEGILAIWFGLQADSIALMGFGIDSFIETVSASIVWWRLNEELKEATTEKVDRAERLASKIAGSLLLILAVYVACDALRRLFGYGEHPRESPFGIITTIIAPVVMFILSKSKLKTAAKLNSKALKTDAVETMCCAWLSITTLGGLILNILFGWWWADSIAALILVPLITREGIEAMRGEENCCHSYCEDNN